MAEHRPILKNNQNTHYPRIIFTTKTSKELPETGVLFFVFTVLWRRGDKN